LIPLRDTISARRLPIVNGMLIAACAAAFVAELRAGSELEKLFDQYALIPARFFALSARAGLLDPAVYQPFVTSAFLHAGWAHFLGNMIFLWIFGDNVEDRFGHAGYALFYLLAAIASGATHVAAQPGSLLPTVGASGAIAAVMGAYFLLYPRARVVSLVLVFFWIEVVSVPAFLYLGLWFLLQLAAGTAALGTEADAAGGVAWWAHLGGFAFGVLAILALGRQVPRHV
jgi:membrane associated rhomboid family serine protease